MLTIYTDGGCDPNPGVGGWGVAAYEDRALVFSDCGGELESTNNRMEMRAIIKALEYAAGRACEIRSDSQLCVNTLTVWAAGWRANGWKKKKAKDGEIKNLDLVQQAFALKEANPLARIVWVKGHAGEAGNELADELATRGRQTVLGQPLDAPAPLLAREQALPYEALLSQRNQMLAVLQDVHALVGRAAEAGDPAAQEVFPSLAEIVGGDWFREAAPGGLAGATGAA